MSFLRAPENLPDFFRRKFWKYFWKILEGFISAKNRAAERKREEIEMKKTLGKRVSF